MTGSLTSVKRLLAIIAFLSAFILGLSACGGESSDYAVKINGQKISSKTILDELHTITSNPRYVALLDQQLGSIGGGAGLQPSGKNTVNATYTAQLVFNRAIVALIDQDIKKNNVTISPDQTRQAEEAVRKDLGDDALFDNLPASYRAYLVERLAKLNAVVAARDTPQKEHEYYDSHVADFTQYCVRHILVNSETQATQLRKQIVEDGGDFAALAKTNSLDNNSASSSASQGGALGCFSATDMNQFIAEFRDAALSLPVNQVSQPVKTEFGFHLIEVTSKTQQTFEQAQPAIGQQLGNVDSFLSEALGSAKIDVNPRFGTYVPGNPSLGTSPTVNPPAVNAVTPRSTSSTTDPSMQQYQQQLTPEQLQQLQQQQQ
jgi:parvulin-like peptidyl-prolyl isomerase